MSTDTSFRAERWVPVTPSANAFTSIPSALLVTAAGNITMEDDLGTSITIAVDAGPLPYRPEKITAATATVYALY